MEQTKVNMIPNNEVKTIHCSKGDGNTRKWGFELYKEDGIIPSSSISPQMFFDSYKGGTEQILPENGSNPTTSPIIADIQYPDSLRSEQTFLYRESPTSEDGQAKITHIKGNTVVFNQLVQNGNFADGTNGWARVYAGSISASDNVLTYTNNTGQTIANWQTEVRTPTFSIPVGHIVYCSYDINPISNVGMNAHIAVSPDGNIGVYFAPSSVPQNTWTHMTLVTSFDRVVTNFNIRMLNGSVADGATAKMKNFMLVDLTQMFGSGNEPTSVDQFTFLYSLPYYDYTQGKLLPFKGESLKTTGKNFYQQVTWYRNNSNSVDVKDNNNKARIKSDVFPLKKGTYVVSGYPSGTNPIALRCYDVNYNLVESPTFTNDVVELTEGAIEYGSMLFGGSDFTSDTNTLFYNANIQLESGSTATTYEPYTSSTINLPTLTYFSSGMKSAGSVYDEITESKAITRVGSVDLGSLSWSNYKTGGFKASLTFKSASPNVSPNLLVANYTSVPSSATLTDFQITGFSNEIYMVNTSYGTDATAFKNAMSGQYLYYELATPTDTPINTASLVSEQAEIPLYEDDDILIGECTTQLSSESGFIPTKIKYQDDSGVAYSQKINLHVEK